MLLLVTMPTLAQKSQASFGLDLALPSDFGGMGIGVSERFERFVTNRASMSLTAGYYSFSPKDLPNSAGSTLVAARVSMAPIQLGARLYFPSSKISPGAWFITFESGVHLVNTRLISSALAVKIASESNFSFAPGLGIRIRRFDVEFRQQFITHLSEQQQIISNQKSSINFTTIRLAYVLYSKPQK